ncbi:PucR family transcriptional regulator [Streptomyces sp. NPDC020800]|uniref:PucR family transcriptional regulator n=1 Tax=Streptomyces sp. NPDC020800 TaxID=3365092 RepID=UPI00379AB78A
MVEAAFAHLDELSRLTGEGYNHALLGQGGDRECRRADLVQALIGERPAAAGVIRQMAENAEWRLPDTVRAVVMDPSPPGESPKARQAKSFGDDVLMASHGDALALIVPDTGRDTASRIESMVAGHLAAVGPPVAVAEAARSFGWARELLRLGTRGLGGSCTILHVTEHLCTLAFLRDEPLARLLIECRLGPLRSLTPKQKTRISDTLLAWIKTSGNAVAAASHLGVHPQTVRSRVRHIERLFGDEFKDPDCRFELEIALRLCQLRISSSRSHAAGDRDAFSSLRC